MKTIKFLAVLFIAAALFIGCAMSMSLERPDDTRYVTLCADVNTKVEVADGAKYKIDGNEATQEEAEKACAAIKKRRNSIPQY